jgi:hypothetical protein
MSTSSMLSSQPRRSVSLRPNLYKNIRRLGRAVLAGAIESKLMGGHLKPGVRKLYRFNFILLFDQDVVYAIAPFADEVLMSVRQRIETLQSPLGQHLEFFVDNELLQISINGSETNVGNFFSNFFIHLVGRGMGIIVLNSVPDNFELLGIS